MMDPKLLALSDFGFKIYSDRDNRFHHNSNKVLIDMWIDGSPSMGFYNDTTKLDFDEPIAFVTIDDDSDSYIISVCNTIYNKDNKTLEYNKDSSTGDNTIPFSDFMKSINNEDELFNILLNIDLSCILDFMKTYSITHILDEAKFLRISEDKATGDSVIKWIPPDEEVL